MKRAGLCSALLLALRRVGPGRRCRIPRMADKQADNDEEHRNGDADDRPHVQRRSVRATLRRRPSERSCYVADFRLALNRREDFFAVRKLAPAAPIAEVYRMELPESQRRRSAVKRERHQSPSVPASTCLVANPGTLDRGIGPKNKHDV